MKQAKLAGFTLFAWITDLKRSKRKDNRDKPKFVTLPLLGSTLVCPEQIMGKDRVTCSKCKWCVNGKGNVAFMQH